MGLYSYHNVEIARQRELELKRRARKASKLPALESTAHHSVAQTVTIRIASTADESELESLAQLDSASMPCSPLLIAALSGVTVAAISLADGVVIADPFRPTAEIVALLRLRAAQLDGTPRRGLRALVRWVSWRHAHQRVGQRSHMRGAR